MIPLSEEFESKYVDFIGAITQARIGDTVIPQASSMVWDTHMVIGIDPKTHWISVIRPYASVHHDAIGNPHVYSGGAAIPYMWHESYTLAPNDSREWRIVGMRASDRRRRL